MSTELKDALITFGRALFSAGVAAAIVFVTGLGTALFSTAPEVIAKGAIIAFLTGALMFAGTYLRNVTTEPVPTGPMASPDKRVSVGRAGAHLERTRSWADLLPI